VLPKGVYGFTYSPGLHNAPLFTTRRYRSYETHKLPTGEVFLIGFATDDAARQLTSSSEVTVVVQPEPDDQASTIVEIAYARIRFHKQYSAPNQHGFTVTVLPA
jgi:hypothetical protein